MRRQQTTLFADTQDLLRQRRLERGLPADQPPLASARRLLLLGGAIGTGLLALVLFSWALIGVRNQLVMAEIGRMSGVPGQLKDLQAQLLGEKAKLDQQSKSNDALAGGLVAVSSGSALVSQLGQLLPQGVQITEAIVAGQDLSLKGRADDPAAFTRVNAFSLLLAYAPMFKPDGVRVIKLTRDTAAPAPGAAAPVPVVNWELSAGLATLKPAQQLPLLRKLGADGMAARLKELERMGVLP